MTTDLYGFKLCRRRDDLQDTLELGAGGQREKEGLHCDERDVVVRSNHSRVQRRNTIIILIQVDDLSFRQFLQCVLNQL